MHSEETKRKIAAGQCDTPKCVRLDHLFLGTRQDNVDDMVAKGRQRKGSKCSMAKLTEAKVRQIRKLYKSGRYSQGKLAGMYGVHQCCISGVVRRTTWKHVLD